MPAPFQARMLATCPQGTSNLPTILTHAVVPLMLGAAARRRVVSQRLLAAGAIAAMLPDADVVAFKLHIAYADHFGHRGATHSVAFAVLLALIAGLGYRRLNSPPWQSGLFIGLAALSHPLLDACTDGGLGVALGWPLSDARWFAPFHPIAVSPIGARFFSERGWQVMASEFCWVWLPTAVIAICMVAWRRTSKRV